MLDLEQLAESEELFDGHYKLMYPLSTDGATADIWLAVDTNTVDESESDEEQGLKVAIKIYRPQNALDIEGIQRFRNEFKVVFNCQHSNLLRPMHFGIFKETPYLILPYCQRGSAELLTGQFRHNKDIWKFIFDVISGLNYLHTNNPPIIHQDLKPANILIGNNNSYMITDFGTCEIMNHGNDESCGTMAYMAPERFHDGYIPIPQSDIWAFGAMLYELITEKVPFGEGGGSIQFQESMAWDFPVGISDKITKIVISCLDYDPYRRPTAAQLLKACANSNEMSGNVGLNIRVDRLRENANQIWIGTMSFFEKAYANIGNVVKTNYKDITHLNCKDCARVIRLRIVPYLKMVGVAMFILVVVIGLFILRICYNEKDTHYSYAEGNSLTEIASKPDSTLKTALLLKDKSQRTLKVAYNMLEGCQLFEANKTAKEADDCARRAQYLLQIGGLEGSEVFEDLEKIRATSKKIQARCQIRYKLHKSMELQVHKKHN